MSVQRRRFTAEEKLAILQQAKQSGITAVLRKHNLSYSVFHRWKEQSGEKDKEEKAGTHSQVNQRIKELLEENSLLKKIIANQALMLEIKDEELRKGKS